MQRFVRFQLYCTPVPYIIDIMENEERPKGRRRRIDFSIAPKLIIAFVAVAFLVYVAMSSFFVVDQTESAVVLRFGKYNRAVGPGLQMKLPFGVERNINIPTQVVQTLTFGYRSTDSTGTSLTGSELRKEEARMLTGDLNIVDVEWIVQYYISDPIAWIRTVDDRETTIRDISQSVMNQLVGDLPILSIMTNQRTGIEVDAQAKMQEIFDRYGFGIQIVTVKLQNIVPPEGTVQDAFEDVNKAVQDMNRFINEGKEYYNAEIPSAQGEAEKLILQAQGYAAERVNNAKGDTARFSSMLEEYRNSKEITGTRLYIETMENILTQGTGQLTIVDKDLKNFLPYGNVLEKEASI